VLDNEPKNTLLGYQKGNTKMPKAFKEQREGNKGLITKLKAKKKETESS